LAFGLGNHNCPPPTYFCKCSFHEGCARMILVTRDLSLRFPRLWDCLVRRGSNTSARPGVNRRGSGVWDVSLVFGRKRLPQFWSCRNGTPEIGRLAMLSSRLGVGSAGWIRLPLDFCGLWVERGCVRDRLCRSSLASTYSRGEALQKPPIWRLVFPGAPGSPALG
jgi:hypothetical protein